VDKNKIEKLFLKNKKGTTGIESKAYNVKPIRSKNNDEQYDVRNDA
jgi:hypothetical protein